LDHRDPSSPVRNIIKACIICVKVSRFERWLVPAAAVKPDERSFLPG
jgi:hypothetical protein